jgi:aerotaxis receptor
MRNNQPVTNREVEVLDDHAIVSKTDLDGNITYVNPYFTEISGFSEQELLGAPQNIVRHPDMPAEAFADLWASIKSGTPWTGMVKNRCKNGDFYWVRANVTPIREAAAPSATCRCAPARAPPGRQGRAGVPHHAHRIQPRHPHQERPGDPARRRHLLSRLSHVSLAMRIWLATSVVNVLQVIVCGAVLLDGNSAHNYGIFAATFLGLLINVFLWYTLRVSVLQPLDRALQGARSIAAGDLSSSFETEATDEVGQLLRALQQMNSNLIATIRDVRVNVETMAVATRQIAAGNADLSGRTEAQAASLEETASSVEQFSSTVKQNADNSAQANKLAQNASEVAVQGGEIVADVIATMDEINNSSRKIVDIIGLIEGIAFQTNILALNAAVEAARAGEQGRGFAVVAGEVRNLAQRSATAAKDIKNLIDVSVGKVSAGMAQVDRAGATMKEVVASVQQVTAIMKEISVASHEQSIGVDQVNSAIAHMDQVTQQNAALVEEAAAATASLALEAGGLTQAVSLFKFGPARRAPPAPARRPINREAPGRLSHHEHAFPTR